MSTVKLQIDDKEVSVREGTTVFQASKSIGIEIPSKILYICHGYQMHNSLFGNGHVRITNPAACHRGFPKEVL